MDKFEKEVIQSLYTAIGVKSHNDLYRHPVMFYDVLYTQEIDKLFSQVPYIDSNNNIRYSDFVIHDSTRNISHRIECRTLRKYGNLSFSIVETLMSIHTLKENELILLLSGGGFGKVPMESFNQIIKNKSYPVKIFQSIDDYLQYLKTF